MSRWAGRPLLLVDFDGVLNPFAAAECPPGFVEYGLSAFPGEEPVLLNTEHARWLRELSAVYDLAWASACPADLNRYCRDLIGLDPMPRVPMPATPFHPDAKIPAVAAFVGDRAVAWLDDAFGEAAHAWARTRRAATLLVEVDASIGLTARAVSALTDWARSLPTDDEGVPTVRAEVLSDHDEIASVVTRAFGSPNQARLVAAIRASSNFVPGWSLVATVDGRVVGHVMVSYVTLRDDTSEHRVPSLSPLSVSPDHQGRGIGSALVHAVVSAVDATGAPLIVLEGSPWYYPRFGFEYAVPLGITIKLPDWAPAEAAQVLRLSRYDPVIRGQLVYPPAFDSVTE